MQKALVQMHLQLHHVVADITGKTGMRIIRAILDGVRDPLTLASYRDARCKAAAETIAQALAGNYRPEHLFALSQAVALYDAYQRHVAGRDRIARLRRELGLRCRQKRKFKATTNSNHRLPGADNRLDQPFSPTAPNRIWVTDITSIPTDEGWLYLAGLKDVFTCEIVGYAMGERMTQELTARALFRAVQQKRPPQGLIHHSDRGSQYGAHDYRALVESFGFKASMSRKGNGYDNAPMESFWGSLKNELVHHHRFTTRAEAESAIREYIEIFYNRHNDATRALATWLRPSLCKIEPMRPDLTQAEVSAIDSTPQRSPAQGDSSPGVGSWS